ncbi:MAG: hypothetical protein ACFB51_06640 [Anaerolineae bacterium]
MLTDWLLDSTIPLFRYLTLRHLLDAPEDDPRVQAARRAMQTAGPIPAIYAGQSEAGHWAEEHSYYTPKYTSTHWSLLLLAELAADPADERLQRGIDYMLGMLVPDLNVENHGWECFWGNLLVYAVHGGRQDDPRVQRIVDYLVQHAGWRCEHNDELPCAWGSARALWGLAVLPERSPAVEATIAGGVDFLLSRHSLLAADYPTPGAPHKMWGKVNFPLFYQADVLFVLRVLAAIDRLDHPDAQPALGWLADRRRANGTWSGASPFRSRTWAALGDRTETTRWVSLQAATVLKQAGMLAAA